MNTKTNINFSIGDNVEHDDLGPGSIVKPLKAFQEDDSRYATVRFQNGMILRCRTKNLRLRNFLSKIADERGQIAIPISNDGKEQNAFEADVLAAFASYMGQQLTTEVCPQKHPCINQCNAHLATDGICTGCWRSVDEIRDYNGMTDKEKSVVALLCRARRDIPRLAGTLAALPDGTKKNITSYGVACFMLGRRSEKIDKIVGGS